MTERKIQPLYINENALMTDVVSYLKIRMQNGADPREAYKEAVQTLSAANLVNTPPYGVRGAGEKSHPKVDLENAMRELGHGYIVEGLQPGQQFVASKRSIY